MDQPQPCQPVFQERYRRLHPRPRRGDILNGPCRAQQRCQTPPLARQGQPAGARGAHKRALHALPRVRRGGKIGEKCSGQREGRAPEIPANAAGPDNAAARRRHGPKTRGGGPNVRARAVVKLDANGGQKSSGGLPMVRSAVAMIVAAAISGADAWGHGAAVMPLRLSPRAVFSSSACSIVMKERTDPAIQMFLALSAAALVAGWGGPAVADGRSGQEIFSLKCAACHAGGGNTLNRGKTLSKVIPLPLLLSLQQICSMFFWRILRRAPDKDALFVCRTTLRRMATALWTRLSKS